MSATSTALQSGRWGAFGLKLAAYWTYGLLCFTAKPGSRTIVPVLMCLAAWWWRYRLEFDLFAATYRLGTGGVTTAAYVAGGVIALCVWFIVAQRWWRIRRYARLTGRGLRFVIKLAVIIGIVLAIAVYAGGAQLSQLTALLAWLPQHVGLAVGPWDVALAFCVIVASCVYTCLSRLLTLILGVFPVLTRPLAPLKALKASNRVIRALRVSVVVPPLKALPPLPG